MAKERTPPHDNLTEQAVLGAMMQSRKAAISIMGDLSGSRGRVVKKLFNNQGHDTIYGLIKDLVDAGEPVDVVTVSTELRRMANTGVDSAYVIELATNAPPASAVVHQVNYLIDLAWKREMLPPIMDIYDKLNNPSADPDEVMELVGGIHKVSSGRGGPKKLSEYMPGVLGDIDDASSHKEMAGVPSGYSDLDKKTAGHQRGSLCIIAGRPGMGKTSFMNCLATNAVKDGFGVLFFTAETGGKEFALRTLSTEAKINSMLAKRGKLADEDYSRVAASVGAIEGWEYHIDDTIDVTVETILSRGQQAKVSGLADIIFVDYIQKLTSSKRHGSIREEVSYYAATLKRLARVTNLPVVAGSQIARAGMDSKDKRPQLWHLKESGRIEEEADLVIGLHRPEEFASDKEKAEGKMAGLAEVIILKQRNGPTGTIQMYFNKTYTRFEPLQTEGFMGE
jgi:replicative DNA helicase